MIRLNRCFTMSVLVIFGLNVALKTDLSKNFQEKKTEISRCVRMFGSVHI